MRAEDLDRELRALASAPGHVCFSLTEDLHGCRSSSNAAILTVGIVLVCVMCVSPPFAQREGLLSPFTIELASRIEKPARDKRAVRATCSQFVLKACGTKAKLRLLHQRYKAGHWNPTGRKQVLLTVQQLSK